MHIEINKSLPNTLKPLLAYRGGFSIVFLAVFLISTYVIYPDISNYTSINFSNAFSLLKTLIIPFTSCLLLIYHIGKGVYFFIIIKNGIITKGKRLKTAIISSKYETFDQYEISFEYFVDPNKTTKQITSVATYDYNKFENEPEKLIIFHKNKHQKALLVDDLTKPIANYMKQNWI